MDKHKRVIRVGSRASKLAVIQAEMVIQAIRQYDSSIETELVAMKTSGDILLDRSLESAGGKNLFVKELDLALLDGRVDITVNSFKDMPMETNKDLPVVAVSAREDPRDVLVLPQGKPNTEKPFGCSSVRRKLQMETLFEHAVVAPVRGNVLTRLKKLDAGEFSALVLAAAGIKRLGLAKRISRYFSTKEMIPAACQGILAVQARRGENVDFLSKFHSSDAYDAALAERSFVTILNGGCSSPVAAFAQVAGSELLLTGLYVDESGAAVKGSIRGGRSEAAQLGEELVKQLRSAKR